jgi:hypothetical protein
MQASASTPAAAVDQAKFDNGAIRPFDVDIPQQDLDDLRRRIAATRWPSTELVDDRSQGVQLATIQALARYWTSDYDWRSCEARLNALPHRQVKREVEPDDHALRRVQRLPGQSAQRLLRTRACPCL